MNEKLKYVVMALLVIIIILLMVNRCQRGGGGGLPVGVISTDTVVKLKVEYRVKHDTIFRVRYVDVKPHKVPAPTKVDKKDSTLLTYNDSFVTPDIVLFYEAKTKGILMDFKPSFRLKSQTIRDSIFKTEYITKTITTVKERNALYLSLTVGYNAGGRKPEAGAGLMFASKRGFTVGYTYLAFSNTHLVNAGYRLFPLRK